MKQLINETIKTDIEEHIRKLDNTEFEKYKMCYSILKTELENLQYDLSLFKQYPISILNDIFYGDGNTKKYVYLRKENGRKTYQMKRCLFKNISCNDKKHLISFHKSEVGSMIMLYFYDLQDKDKKILSLLERLSKDFSSCYFMFDYYWKELIHLNLVKMSYDDINNIIMNTYKNKEMI